MSFGRVALGLASIAMGVSHLSNGVKRLSGPQSPRPRPRQQRHFDGFMGAVGAPAPLAMPGRAFHSASHGSVRASNGTSVPMQMRSFNIRTLDDRIAYLKRLVDAGKRDPQVYAFARRALTKTCGDKWCLPEKDNLAEAKAIFNAVRGSRSGSNNAQTKADLASARKMFRQIRKNVRYTSDIAGVDTYQKPAHTLALRSGDCDDYSTLTCAALQSVGIPCRFKVIRTKDGNDWNHIYPQAGFPRAKPERWLSMDSSVNMPFGWEAPPRMVAASRVFRVG